jgi:UDP-N-acetylglucosamine--N-acetylmuramyl-(pentapeptide) pyrophosphoryl-undecaprenol N-acetylglucosamine transferase
MVAGIRIAIAAGGTAGHVVPALAVADELRERGASVFFIGGNRAERELVPAAGYELLTIAVEGLSRRNPLRAARAAARSAAATALARRLLRDGRARAVMGGGGYVAGPVALAGATLGLPVILTEADSRLGLANRALAPLARRVCLAFPLAGRDTARYLVTGRPCPAPSVDRMAARAALGLAPDTRLLVVFGGSLGARSINEAAFGAFAQDAPGEVLHVAGARDYAALAERPRGRHYDLREYLPTAEFGAALVASDLVIARAGGSIFEIAAAGRPAILIPYPHAAGEHQATNAAWMDRAGAAIVIADGELNAAGLRAAVERLLADPGGLAAMAAASAALARPDAAGLIAGEILAAARAG